MMRTIMHVNAKKDLLETELGVSMLMSVFKYRMLALRTLIA